MQTFVINPISEFNHSFQSHFRLSIFGQLPLRVYIPIDQSWYSHTVNEPNANDVDHTTIKGLNFSVICKIAFENICWEKLLIFKLFLNAAEDLTFFSILVNVLD